MKIFLYLWKFLKIFFKSQDLKKSKKLLKPRQVTISIIVKVKCRNKRNENSETFVFKTKPYETKCLHKMTTHNNKHNGLTTWTKLEVWFDEQRSVVYLVQTLFTVHQFWPLSWAELGTIELNIFNSDESIWISNFLLLPSLFLFAHATRSLCWFSEYIN